MWVAPGFGALRDGDPTPNDNVDSARNFWNQSPKIAKARYQATTDYVWAFDINVVKIVLGQGTLVATENIPFLTFPGEIVQARSRIDERALQSTYTIELMEGPTRGNGLQRGREQMLVGYIQLLGSAEYSASYSGGHAFRHVMHGNTYVDTISIAGETTVFPWYDSGNFTSQGVLGKGVLRGSDYLANAEARNIAMSDSPYPYFELRDPHPNRTGLLQSAQFKWDFQLIVAVATLEVTTENRSNPPGNRYPFFRRAVSSWNYEGTISRTGNLPNDLALNSNGIQIIRNWAEEENGSLAFDLEINRSVSSGVPIVANTALNFGEGNGIWFEQ